MRFQQSVPSLTVAMTLAAVSMLPSAARGQSAGSTIIRETTAGTRAEELRELERTPFDLSLYGELSDWFNGEPATAATTDGKVVVFYTWSSFRPVTMRPMGTLRRLVDRYGEEDLVVVGVHQPEAYEDAKQAAERRRVNFPIARDESGRFREALLVDQDPDFYMVDRAGQLRYADVATASLEDAVRMLVNESASEAGTLNERLETQRARAREEARRTRLLRQQMRLGEMPDVPFEQPPASAYEEADWPTLTEFVLPDDLFGDGDDPDEIDPYSVEIPSGDWHPSPPSDIEGKLRMIYLWSTEQGIGAANEFYDQIQRVQAAHKRDVVVMGVAVRVEESRRRRRSNDEPDTRLAELNDLYRDFIDEKRLNHPVINKMDDNAFPTTLLGLDGRGRGEFATSATALISTDGNVRWIGYFGIENDEFRAALSKMLREDPGVQARRQAEEAYILEATE